MTPSDGRPSTPRRATFPRPDVFSLPVRTPGPRPFGTYEIRRSEDGRTIGGLDFHGTPDENGSVTIGYGLIPSAQGKGYASEALRALLAFARAHGVTSVEGDTDHDNTASQHVMAAVGMRLVAEDERLKYYKITWNARDQQLEASL